MISFKVFGVRINISFSFTLLITLLAIVDKTSLLFVSFIAVFVHELGHFLIIKILGIKDVEIFLVLASVKVSMSTYLNAKSTALVALGGPMLNLILSSFIMFDDYYLQYFGAANIILFLFNMLPILNLDGGDVFKYLLFVTLKNKGDKVFMYISHFVLIVLISLGSVFFLGKYNNPTVLIVGIYLLIMSYTKV